MVVVVVVVVVVTTTSLPHFGVCHMTPSLMLMQEN
jgi:hypothetical protein